ncbi:MAG: BON domain-containing protein [Halomonas sp.]|nr:BON domain-containing protein [Halomonas sp.]MDR9438309.1 BON domain-containing protein [Halomonas sp.]
MGGAAAGASALHSRRSVGTFVDDQSIELKARLAILENKELSSQIHASVTSFNGVVLLTGQVPSEELKVRAEAVADKVRNVREVHNELSIAANLPASQRLSDTWLRARIRTSLAANEEIDSGRIRVIVENNSVYLMGIVTRNEAERIVQAVSNVGGMQRIVKVFDYLD